MTYSYFCLGEAGLFVSIFAVSTHKIQVTGEKRISRQLVKVKVIDVWNYQCQLYRLLVCICGYEVIVGKDSLPAHMNSCMRILLFVSIAEC